jgi:UDP-N-acetylglucosamine/UDP-N-acetylgalactosamine 4-epimerase
VIPLFVDKILKGDKVDIDGDGEQTRDFTYVANAVQANIRAMLTDSPSAYNNVYNIAVGENFSVNRMYTLIQEYLDIQLPPNHREARKGDIRNSLADITKAKTLLGYEPGFRFEEGLKHTVEYFKKHFGY